jgi:antirestriction protein ArdC
MRPVNVASKRPYRGINVVALWAYAEESGHSSGIWGTYRQWSEIGAQVRKGEKAAFVVFYKELEFAGETETGEADTVTRLFARATPVFAAEQVDGYQPPVIDAPPATIITPIEQAEALVRATGASIHHGGGRAFYRTATDSIQLPPREAFIGSPTSTPAEAYYSTILHELTHNAAIRIMPHGLRWRPVVRASAMRHNPDRGIMQSVFSLASRRETGGESALQWIATVS